MSLTARIRIVRRFPGRSYRWWLSWLTRSLTRSQLGHCAIGFDGAVLDPDLRGNRFWPFIPFALRYPTLTCCITVPVQSSIDLDRHPPGVPKRALPTVLRWITFGATAPTDDCVCTVVECLRQGGLAPPRRIVSPRQLHKWLLAQGFHHETLC